MKKIRYIKFNDVDLIKFLPILNEDRVRDHLVLHPEFNATNISAWVKDKIECDALTGCRTRVITLDGEILGWCGIQPDNENYELAIVLSTSCWGIGPTIFKDLLSWAKELNHKEVIIHLLETRPEYKFLKRVSTNVIKTKMLNREFTTYHIPV